MTRFEIRMGLPDVEPLYRRLEAGLKEDTLSGKDKAIAKKVLRCVLKLSIDPRDPSLETHKIDDLSRFHKFEVFESYVENRCPGAYRIFWTYGPEPKQITVLAIVPHPENNAYARVPLSTDGFEKQAPPVRQRQRAPRRR